jgi:hypothetical protein
MTKIMQEHFKHCIVDLGDAAEQRPDILVFAPDTYHDEKDRLRYDLENWSDEIVAVEVEVDPTKHSSQVVTNYTKNFEKGFDVWFVVFSENHRDYINKILKDATYSSVHLVSCNQASAFHILNPHPEILVVKHPPVLGVLVEKSQLFATPTREILQ